VGGVGHALNTTELCSVLRREVSVEIAHHAADLIQERRVCQQHLRAADGPFTRASRTRHGAMQAAAATAVSSVVTTAHDATRRRRRRRRRRGADGSGAAVLRRIPDVMQRRYELLHKHRLPNNFITHAAAVQTPTRPFQCLAAQFCLF
jgi:hypothetical protein